MSVSRVTSGLGAGIATLGIALHFLFSPSPHGYLEAFIALPVFLGGVALVGCGLAIQWPWRGWLFRTGAIVCLMAGVVPLALLVSALARP